MFFKNLEEDYFLHSVLIFLAAKGISIFLDKGEELTTTMYHVPMKCTSNAEEDENVVGKKVIKLRNKVNSIIDRSKDSWNMTSAYQRVTTDLGLYRSFMLMILPLFKGDLGKL